MSYNYDRRRYRFERFMDFVGDTFKTIGTLMIIVMILLATLYRVGWIPLPLAR